MRSITLTAAVLAGGAALAVAATHYRRRPAPVPVDLDQVIAGARRLADVLESGDPIMQGLVTHGSDLVDVPKGFGRLLAGFADPQNLAGDRWAALPAAPLREGVGYLHDWLASGAWQSPFDVLRELRAQAPIRPIADLMSDLAIDLDAAGPDYREGAAALREAEQQLRAAAEHLGETDYSTETDTEPHAWDCEGGCGGTGEVMQILTWDDQGEGVLVPVHQEPGDCRRGEPEPEHPGHCQCRGTGSYRSGGYVEVCLDPVLPVGEAPAPTGVLLDADPWQGARAMVPAIPTEPPF